MATRVLRPSIIIKRKALTQGIFGDSRRWRVIAIVVFGIPAFRRVFGKNSQLLGVLEMKGPGHVIQVETYRKPTRRQRRRAGAAGTSIT
jgi:hypothetical protein